jgi:hypothetical protein
MAQPVLGHGLAGQPSICAMGAVREPVSRGVGFGRAAGRCPARSPANQVGYPGAGTPHNQARTGTVAWVTPHSIRMSRCCDSAGNPTRESAFRGDARAAALPCARAHRSAGYDRARTVIDRQEVVQLDHFDIASAWQRAPRIVVLIHWPDRSFHSTFTEFV